MDNALTDSQNELYLWVSCFVHTHYRPPSWCEVQQEFPFDQAVLQSDRDRLVQAGLLLGESCHFVPAWMKEYIDLHARHEGGFTKLVKQIKKTLTQEVQGPTMRS